MPKKSPNFQSKPGFGGYTKAAFFWFLVICLLSALPKRREQKSPDAPKPISLPKLPFLEIKILDVTDGDSFEADLLGAKRVMRLQGVDCPEWKQRMGPEAKAFTQQWLKGKNLKVKILGSDTHGRLLVYLYDDKENLLNADILSSGMAWWFERYSYDKDLKALADLAKQEKKGIWADEAPVPPWEFRKNHRE